MPVGPRILLIGYGNPGRRDDGLGPALAARVEALGLPDVTVDSDYQLTVDHALLIAAHDLVIFADAMIGLAEPFRLDRLTADPAGGLGSHQVSPEAALHLAGLLYGQAPPGWMLAIAGQSFGEVAEGLSPTAAANLAQAADFLAGWIVDQAKTAS